MVLGYQVNASNRFKATSSEEVQRVQKKFQTQHMQTSNMKILWNGYYDPKGVTRSLGQGKGIQPVALIH